MISDAARQRWVRETYAEDGLNLTLDGMRKPSRTDRLVEGEHVLFEWRQRVDEAMATR